MSNVYLSWKLNCRNAFFGAFHALTSNYNYNNYGENVFQVHIKWYELHAIWWSRCHCSRRHCSRRHCSRQTLPISHSVCTAHNNIKQMHKMYNVRSNDHVPQFHMRVYTSRASILVGLETFIFGKTTKKYWKKNHPRSVKWYEQNTILNINETWNSKLGHTLLIYERRATKLASNRKKFPYLLKSCKKL